MLYFHLLVFCRGALFCCFCSFSSCFRVMKLPSLFVGLFISVLIDLWHLRNINLKGTFVFVPIFSPVICFYLFSQENSILWSFFDFFFALIEPQQKLDFSTKKNKAWNEQESLVMNLHKSSLSNLTDLSWM